MWYRKAKKQKHTGVMIALQIPQDVAQKIKLNSQDIPIPDDNFEDISDFHITLVYLGEAKAIKDKKDLIHQVIKGFADAHKPIKGHIGGTGVFNTIQKENNTKPIYASFDSPDLPKLRQELVEMLESIGIKISETHGFTPHITLAYVPEKMCYPLTDFPQINTKIKELIVGWEGEHTIYQLKDK